MNACPGLFHPVVDPTVLGSGRVAGIVSRDRYEALRYSGVLVVICCAVFVATGLV
jgi:hypothetical protein